MEYIKCNLCGSEDHRAVYSRPDILFHKNEWFNVVECNRCGLGFVNPRPSFNEMGKYYPSAFYDYFEDDITNHLIRYKKESEFIEGISAKDRILLDIGCANGGFPRFMRKIGWQVEGVEISANSKSISDFKVYKEDFSQIPVSTPRYDVITAWAVLEHVHDPMTYFIKVAEVLKPNGLFVFLVTNFKSISSKFLFSEDIPRHLYFFTEETIKMYLAHAGLELIKADYSNKIYSMRPVNWLRYYIYRYVLQRKLAWKDMPDNRMEYLVKRGLKNNIFSNIKYSVTHPLTVIDRVLVPIVEKLQIASGNYGIVTFVARKSKRG